MTTKKTTPIAWATFISLVRISPMGSQVPAIAASPTTTLAREDWDGIPVLVVSDASLGSSVRIPFSAIGSFALG